MFVCVARVTLQIPESGSLKAKRQVLRRVSDRVKARFNVSVAEVGDNDLWQKAVLAMCVVGNDRRHVNEQMDKILDFVEQMYVAPVIHREIEILAFGDRLYGGDDVVKEEDGEEDAMAAIDRHLSLKVAEGERSLAEAEGLGDWEERHGGGSGPKKLPTKVGAHKGDLSLDEARARARTLRNPREWEKK
ncbi:MAG: DUF503 domain-containing protein [Myxococcaceae bacterium]